MNIRLSMLLMAIAVIIVMIACSKDNSTSSSRQPYFDSELYITPFAVKGQNVVASIKVVDPQGKQVSVKFDWGDGSAQTYTELVDSVEFISSNHIYSQIGEYQVKAYAKNESGDESGVWSAATTIKILNPGVPYVQEIVVDKIELIEGHQIQASAQLEELSGFQVQARVDWGDGLISNWSDLEIPGSWHYFNHNYATAGSYQVKVQARSSEDSLSVWFLYEKPVKVVATPPANSMVMIPSGTFFMGSVGAGALANEAPLDSINVAAFYMSKFEITQNEWQAVMGNNPAHFASNTETYAPVENVDWYDCIEYCNRRSVLESLAPCYGVADTSGALITDMTLWPANWHPAYPDSGAVRILCDLDANGYRLPTEAEWEYAARANATSIYSGTDDIDELADYAWYGAYPYQTHIVGLKQPNAFGLYDMTGNVWEWCWNSYRLYPGNTATLNAFNKSLKIARGGSFSSNGNTIRVSYRATVVSSLKNLVYGLRVVRKV